VPRRNITDITTKSMINSPAEPPPDSAAAVDPPAVNDEDSEQRQVGQPVDDTNDDHQRDEAELIGNPEGVPVGPSRMASYSATADIVMAAAIAKRCVR
jgi:hypothetical protein